MKSMFIKMDKISDIQDFVIAASAIGGDILCRRGHWTVDGKSLLGLMSIDVSQGITVEYPENAKSFESFIAPFESH